MDQSRGLQGVPLSFAPQVSSRELAELPVDERHELSLGPLGTVPPFRQQPRDFMGDRCFHLFGPEAGPARSQSGFVDANWNARFAHAFTHVHLRRAFLRAREFRMDTCIQECAAHLLLSRATARSPVWRCMTSICCCATRYWIRHFRKPSSRHNASAKAHRTSNSANRRIEVMRAIRLLPLVLLVYAAAVDAQLPKPHPHVNPHLSRM